MNQEELLLIDRQEHICTVSINRPRSRNALSPEVLTRIEALMRELNGDDAVRVVIFRGVGQEAFSSGYDITSIPENSSARSDPLEGDRILERAMSSLEEYRYPTIAMIYGYCMGAAFELASACDLRVVADTAKLAVPAAKLGVIYRREGILRWLNLLGPSGTKELLFSGRTWSAQKAQAAGWANEVLPAEELEKYTYDLAAEIVERSPLSIAGTKAIISKLLGYQSLSPANQAACDEIHLRFLDSFDFEEGRRAFAERRRPKFLGR